MHSTEYDPNPLLSLSKRRRRTSASISTEERRLSQNQCVFSPEPTQESNVKDMAIFENKELETIDSEVHRERKRLKKRKRDKLKQKLLHDDKKKKRKHKCLETHCKHRKHHKKHRKHKKHHHCVDLPLAEDKNENVPNVESFEDTTETNDTEEFPEYQIVMNPEDEVTMDDIIEANKTKVKKFAFIGHYLFITFT